MITKKQQQNDLLRALPSIDSLLKTATAKSLKTSVGADHLTVLARRVTDEMRRQIVSGKKQVESNNGDVSNRALAFMVQAEALLLAEHNTEIDRGLKRVINATGVILHTNLGRAPLSARARLAVWDASGYCTLEYDLGEGSRGRRGVRAEELLVSLTGAEAALVVNNCAAAALLALTVLARDGETIVSRGELVEIGGDFRVPEVMAESGTQMIEVGTTNRTKLADYKKAISENTKLILRVHTSNYRIVGFTTSANLKQLASLAHENGLLLYEDAGSGALFDLSEYGITGEPIIRESFDAGADVISFSGDKLLGGPQIGVLVGRTDPIERMRRHPLYRALRADKLRIAALEATLEAYARGSVQTDIPIYHSITMTLKEIKRRTQEFLDRLNRHGLSEKFVVQCMEGGESAIGGGAAPTSSLKTVLISITHASLSANRIEAALRHSTPPVIARIEGERVLLDLRTVSEADEADLTKAILALSD